MNLSSTARMLGQSLSPCSRITIQFWPFRNLNQSALLNYLLISDSGTERLIQERDQPVIRVDFAIGFIQSEGRFIDITSVRHKMPISLLFY